MTKIGIYKHHSGGLYRVLFVAHDSTNGPREGTCSVIYVSLTTGRVNCREEKQFHERVRVSFVKTVPRFAYVGDEIPKS